MRLFSWLTSFISLRTNSNEAPDLATRIVRIMRREGGIATAEYLCFELATDLSDICAEMQKLLVNGFIRRDDNRDGLHSRQVIYALAY